MANSLIIKNSTYQVDYVLGVVSDISGSEFPILDIKGLTDDAIRDGCPNRLEQKNIFGFVSIVEKLAPTGSLYFLNEDGYYEIVRGSKK